MAQAPVDTPAPADSGRFVVLHRRDTVVVERFSRAGELLQGELVRVVPRRDRENYRAVMAPDASLPLVEVAVRRGDNPPTAPPVQRTRVIFKDDSVAVDDVTSNGLATRIFPSEAGAIPYLNLSFALLEQATRRAAASGRDSLEVPFFNLGGGQTLRGRVIRLAPDRMRLVIGSVAFDLRVGQAGRILGGGIAEQELTVERQ